jgi:hypothetical protein
MTTPYEPKLPWRLWELNSFEAGTCAQTDLVEFN